jgi:hypothetical protein
VAACVGWLRGWKNLHNRYLTHVSGYNFGLISGC